FFNNGTLILLAAKPSDSGRYYVALHDNKEHKTYRRSASLTVFSDNFVREQPVISSRKFEVAFHRHDVKVDGTTQRRLQFSCGTFQTLGNPPVPSVWTTPSGQTMRSTFYIDGFFILYLPIDNWLQSGNYTCRNDPDEPVKHCLDPATPFSASLFVDTVGIRLKALEDQLVEVKTTGAELETLNGEFEDYMDAVLARPEVELDARLAVVEAEAKSRSAAAAARFNSSIAEIQARLTTRDATCLNHLAGLKASDEATLSRIEAASALIAAARSTHEARFQRVEDRFTVGMTTRNVAVKKPTRMSYPAPSSKGGSGRAVDGSRTTDSEQSCALMDYVTDPFWYVDLQDTYHVYAVAITSSDKWRRGTAVMDFFIDLSDEVPTYKNSTTLCTPYAGGLKSEVTDFVVCRPNVRGRYLRVQGHNVELVLCEVEVYPYEEGATFLSVLNPDWK
ncbi:hypothetical protein BaRGS_00028243, partial [Batillaria attramentaria]